MSKNKDIKLDGFATQGAIIIATLQKDKGKATLSDFNKIYKALDNKGLTRRTYDNLFNHLNDDAEKFSDIFENVYNGELSIADLPNAGGSVDVVNDDNLNNVLSTYNKTHEQDLGKLREQRKIIKDGTLMGNLIDEMTTTLSKELKGISTPKYALNKIQVVKEAPEDAEKDVDEDGNVIEPKMAPKKAMVVALADWHLGALVDNAETGGYDFDLLKNRLANFYAEIKRVSLEQGITEFHVYHIGDLIEHISMRNVNQAFETEFTMAEQISKGIGLLVEFLNLVGTLGNVKFGCITGNHDRLDGNKKDAVYNDSAMYVALSQLMMLKDNDLLPNVEIMDNLDDNYTLEDTVFNKRIMVVHGDREKKTNEVKIPSHIKHNEIDYLIMGHIHTTRIIQEDYSRFHVYVGSTMGANNYSKGLNLPTTAPSQMLMVLTEGIDSPVFQPVFL